MQSLRVSLRKEVDASYDIVVDSGLLGRTAGELARGRFGKRLVLVCDETTRALFGETLLADLRAADVQADLLSVPAGEQSKCLAVFERLCGDLRDLRISRKDCLVAVGGGMVGDLTGFVAGCYMRGLPFVQVPTTLLSQVDSSVGGKVAVNLPGAKNYIGLFHQPKKVLVDVDTLASLPPRELDSGLAEVLKYAVIADAEFFSYLEDKRDALRSLEREAVIRTVATCCAIKASIVERDEREAGPRMVLNYGHTLGHAVEDAMHYALTHGECVAYGMRAAARLANAMNLFPAADYHRHEQLLDRYGLAVAPLDLDPDELLRIASGDKKNSGGRITFILPTSLGQTTRRDDVPQDLVRSVLADTLRRA
ncbi:3-dehydroquinate synthase [Desulfovibrio sp. X2]|uniref:3-dehydroquinate synthase n=1 Tax=Desulfovibrio sp. X2 TaxID=941449 RepID=UPI0003589891|nr:3-dehydroquinate synthase [Desulfovibrio sp. X2]EPR43389.1 3-dehydroquinate synthase [Desulfovibrio sp. X2]